VKLPLPKQKALSVTKSEVIVGTKLEFALLGSLVADSK